VGIPVGFLVVWAGGWVLLALVLLALAAGGAREVMGFARARDVRGFRAGWPFRSPSALVAPGGPSLGGNPRAWALPALTILVAAGLLALAATVFLRGPGGPLAAAG
jgi:hypothetical protein